MLTITREAAALLSATRESAGAPDTFGIRFFASEPAESGAPEVAVAFVPAAEPGDELTEQSGVKAFVSPDVSATLDGATLDASPIDGTQELILRR